MTPHLYIACVGDCMVELSGVAHRPKVGIGGDSFNIAVYLSRVLGSDTVSYVTRLGIDPFSDQLVATMQTEGLDTSKIARIPQALPGLYAITLTKGEREFHYWRNQAPVRDLFRKPDPKLKSYLGKVGGMVITGISLAVLGAAGRQRLLTCARGKHQWTGYVVNHRPILWQSAKLARRVHEQAIARADYVLVSDEELAMLWPGKEGVQRLSRLCPGELVLTAGSAGSEIWCTGERVAQISAVKANPVDTTAAGDSFAARYLAGRLQGEEFAVAASFASQLATVVVVHDGAIIPRGKMPRSCLLNGGVKT